MTEKIDFEVIAQLNFVQLFSSANFLFHAHFFSVIIMIIPRLPFFF